MNRIRRKYLLYFSLGMFVAAVLICAAPFVLIRIFDDGSTGITQAQAHLYVEKGYLATVLDIATSTSMTFAGKVTCIRIMTAHRFSSTTESVWETITDEKVLVFIVVPICGLVFGVMWLLTPAFRQKKRPPILVPRHS